MPCVACMIDMHAIDLNMHKNHILGTKVDIPNLFLLAKILYNSRKYALKKKIQTRVLKAKKCRFDL